MTMSRTKTPGIVGSALESPRDVGLAVAKAPGGTVLPPSVPTSDASELAQVVERLGRLMAWSWLRTRADAALVSESESRR